MGSLPRGSLPRGVSAQGCLSRGLCLGSLCLQGVSVQGESRSRGISVQGVSVQEKSVQGGLCQRESLSRGSLSLIWLRILLECILVMNQSPVFSSASRTLSHQRRSSSLPSLHYPAHPQISEIVQGFIPNKQKYICEVASLEIPDVNTWIRY